MKFNGSEKCEECRGRGEISVGERHGFHEKDTCLVCRGRGVVPRIKDTYQRLEHPANSG